MEDFNEPLNEKMFSITKKDNVFIIILTVASVLMSVLGIFGGFRGGFAVVNILLMVVMTLFSFKKDYKFKVSSGIFLAEAILLSLVFLITSNIALRFFGFILSVLVLFLLFFSFAKDERDKNEYDFFASLMATALGGVILNLPVTAKSVFSGDSKSKKHFPKIFIGIVAALPVLTIVIPLLMSSDEAFSGLVKTFGDNAFLSIIKIILGLLIAFFLVTLCLTIKNDGVVSAGEVNLNRIDKTVLISFLSSISVCYVAYLISQLAYFFSAFKGILPSNYSFTMAGYARRGFFEMCIIAIINFFLVFIAVLFVKERNIATKILSFFICVFTLVIISTAISKMFLYIERFGMTQLRILTSAFMIFLAVMFIALIVKIFVTRIVILKFGVILAAAFLIVLGLFNVNSFIANYNYTAYINGKLSTIDVGTIYELGDEGVPYIIKLIQDDDENTSTWAKENLIYYYKYDYYNIEEKYDADLKIYEIKSKKYDSIGSFGISRSKAYKLLDKFIEENPEFLTEEYKVDGDQEYAIEDSPY